MAIANFQNHVRVAAAFQGMGSEPVGLDTAGMLQFLTLEGHRALIHGFATPAAVERNPRTKTSQILSMYELQMQGYSFENCKEEVVDGHKILSFKVYLEGDLVFVFKNVPNKSYGQYWATVQILSLDHFPPTEKAIQRLSSVGRQIYDRGTCGGQHAISVSTTVPVALIEPRECVAPDLSEFDFWPTCELEVLLPEWTFPKQSPDVVTLMGPLAQVAATISETPRLEKVVLPQAESRDKEADFLAAHMGDQPEHSVPRRENSLEYFHAATGHVHNLGVLEGPFQVGLWLVL